MKRSMLLCIITALLLFTTCKKDDRLDRVPSVPVNITINIQQPAYINLQTPGGWEYVLGGDNGIIIYRNAPNEFKAFDRQCTWQVDDFNRISVNEDNITATDASCGSTFLIVDGSITEDPAFVSLTEYETSFNPTNSLLTITN